MTNKNITKEAYYQKEENTGAIFFKNINETTFTVLLGLLGIPLNTVEGLQPINATITETPEMPTDITYRNDNEEYDNNKDDDIENEVVGLAENEYAIVRKLDNFNDAEKEEDLLPESIETEESVYDIEENINKSMPLETEHEIKNENTEELNETTMVEATRKTEESSDKKYFFVPMRIYEKSIKNDINTAIKEMKKYCENNGIILKSKGKFLYVENKNEKELLEKTYIFIKEE